MTNVLYYNVSHLSASACRRSLEMALMTLASSFDAPRHQSQMLASPRPMLQHLWQLTPWMLKNLLLPGTLIKESSLDTSESTITSISQTPDGEWKDRWTHLTDYGGQWLQPLCPLHWLRECWQYPMLSMQTHSCRVGRTGCELIHPESPDEEATDGSW